MSVRLRFRAALILMLLWATGANLQGALGSSSPQEDEAAAHFLAGQKAMQASEIQRAIQEFKQTLRLMPNLAEAHANLGLAYYLEGQYLAAIPELEKAHQLKPQMVAADLFLGLTYQKSGSPAKAIPPLERVLRQEPRNHEAIRALASSYLAENDYRRAVEFDVKLFDLQADKVEAWYALGQNYLAMSKQVNTEVTTQFPGTLWEERLLGDLLAERQKWVDAAARYRHALTLDTGMPGVHAALGNALLRQGETKDAEGEFRAELQSDDRSEEALLGLAAVDLKNGSATLALEKVATMWNIFPPFLSRQTDFPSVEIESPKAAKLAQDLGLATDSPARQFLLASVDRASGQNEQAAQQWSAFLESIQAWSAGQKTGSHAGVEPGNHRALARDSALGADRPRIEEAKTTCAAHQYMECARVLQGQKVRTPDQNLGLGKALLALGEAQEAAGAFADALPYDQTRAPSAYWLARTYETLSQACLQHMLALAPDSWRAHQMRGEYFQSQFAYKEAVEEFQAAVRLHPGSAELHERLGNAYLLNKQTTEGEAEIAEALRLDPSRAHCLYLLGQVYFGKRDIAKSIDYFQRTLQFEPGFLPAHATLGRAYMREGRAASALPELEKAAPTDYYGDLHYLLSMAYRQLGKSDLAAQALAVSEDLRRRSAGHHRASVVAAEEELSEQ